MTLFYKDKNKILLISFIFLLFLLIGCNKENPPIIDNRPTYTVSFYTDCEMVIHDMTVKEGDSIDFVPTLTKDGYEFNGWDSDITKPIYEDTIFTASWVLANYKITYHLDGGENSNLNPTTYTIENSFDLDNPTKPGYDFDGWYKDEYFTKKITTIRKFTTGDMDIYAKFDEITYTINYHLDGGTNNFYNPSNYHYFDTELIDLYPATKQDYKFVGWYKEESFNNLVTKIDPKNGTNLELFARFTKDPLAASIVTFNTNGGKIEYSNNFDYSQKIVEAKATMFETYDTTHGYSATVATKTGNTYFFYICINKTDIKDIYEIVDIAYPVSKITVSSFDYCIAWHASLKDSESKEALDYIYSIKNNMIGGYVELIDLPDSASSSCSIDIIFYSDKAYASGKYFFKDACDLPIPTREGYTFLGWVSNLDGKTTTTYPGYYDAKTINYTAQWIMDKYIGTTIEKTIIDLNEYMNNISEVSTDLSLPTSLNDCEIIWTSLNPDIISNTGAITKPYSTSSITIEAKVKKNDDFETVTYNFDVSGKFHDLSKGIRAGYFYSSSSSVSDYTFRNLDIMFMAFGYPTADGDLGSYSTLGSQIHKNFVEKAHENGVRVVLSINTQNCATIARSDELIEKFANRLAQFVQEFDIDGIDLDWEWPSSSEAPNFTKLVKVINQKVKALNPNYLISAAVGSNQHSRYDLKNSIKYMDYISIMSYDMQLSSTATYQNALYYSKGKTYVAIENSYNNYTASVPASKIIIGIPFYGRYWYNSKGPGTSADYQGATSYSNIYSKYISKQTDTLKEYWDEECEVPYVYDSETGLFISYDNPRSIENKAAYVHDQGLAGLMYWQDSQDYGDTLVTALVDGINKYFK